VSRAIRKGRPVDANKHDAILEQARRMFTALGFTGTSMDELADAAGVSKATIYNHFDSKERLFETVLRALVEQLPTPADLVGGAQGPLPARLARIAHNACELATSPLMHDIQCMLASSQFFSLVASEPFIRMLLGDTPDADEVVASQVEAGVATFLRAFLS